MNKALGQENGVERPSFAEATGVARVAP